MDSKKGIVLRSVGISMALVAGTVFCFPTPSTARVINNATLSVQVGQDTITAAEARGNFFTKEGQTIMLNGDFSEMILPIEISCADLNLEDSIGMTGILKAVSSDENRLGISLDKEEVVLGEETQVVNLTLKLFDVAQQLETENIEEADGAEDVLTQEEETEVKDDSDTESETTPVAESEVEDQSDSEVQTEEETGFTGIILSDLILEIEDQKISEQVNEFIPLGTGNEGSIENLTETENEEEAEIISQTESETVPDTEEGTEEETVPDTEEGSEGETVPDTEEGSEGETEETPDSEENTGNENLPEEPSEEIPDTDGESEAESQTLTVEVTFQVGEKILSTKIVILNPVALASDFTGELQYCPSQYYPTEKIKLIGAADTECILSGFPEMTQYTIEGQSYLLYSSGYITVPAGKEVEVDLSMTEWEEDIILQTGGEAVYTIKYVELPEILEAVTPLIVNEEGNTIAITKTWGTIEPTITIEHLTVSEEETAWETNEIVTAQVDDEGKIHLMPNQTMAGTYRIIVSWIENENTLYQMEIPFFIQYKSVIQGGTGQ